MKLLLDQNISYRLVDRLQKSFPGTTQVRLLGLEQASDNELWEYARDNVFVIVTKDSDFHELSILYGPPPKVIWLKIGNSTASAVAERLEGAASELAAALEQDDIYYVELR